MTINQSKDYSISHHHMRVFMRNLFALSLIKQTTYLFMQWRVDSLYFSND